MSLKTASIADVRAKLSAYVKATGKGPVVITRNGKPVAALVAVVDENDLERLMLGYSPKLRAVLLAARERIRYGRAVPHARFWKRQAARSGRRVPAKAK
jgi:prevent-host-death family protein